MAVVMVKGVPKKPNREWLHLETSGFLHNVDHQCVCKTKFMDFKDFDVSYNKMNFSPQTIFFFILKAVTKLTGCHCGSEN